MKKAKTLFKELGYQIIAKDQFIIKYGNRSHVLISFDLIEKCYTIRGYRGNLEEVLAAINKQIKELGWVAEEPYIYGDGYSDGELVLDTWDCPNCGKTYEVEYERYDYCPNCGQQIKWWFNNEH